MRLAARHGLLLRARSEPRRNPNLPDQGAQIDAYASPVFEHSGYRILLLTIIIPGHGPMSGFDG